MGGGIYRNAPKYKGDTIGYVSLERLHHAMHLSKSVRLPILATEGASDVLLSESDPMRQSDEWLGIWAGQFGVIN
jgi:hypothetical protein